MMTEYTITATCTFGLESILKREIIKLGYEIEQSADGAVSIRGGINDVYKLNLWLRTANRVLIHIADFPANTFDELFDHVKEIPWENYLKSDSKFDVSKINCVKSKLFSKSDCQSIIKKAMIERLKKKFKVERMPESGPNFPLFVNIKNDVAHLFLNTSGESLHRRGYRLQAGEAPLKETLAAGIIRLIGYEGGMQQFADIMCGSGTFVIEAAMIAANMPPGLNRSFAFEEWGWMKAEDKERILAEAKENIRQPEVRLLGSDIDGGVLKLARENAIRAGVEEFVSFQKLDFREFKSKKHFGAMIVNPPYGERIGADKETQKIYEDLRKVYDDLVGWKLFVLSGNDDFQRYFGKKADKNRKLFNGNMQTYLYQYFPEKSPREYAETKYEPRED